MERQAVSAIAQAFVNARKSMKALKEYPGDRPTSLADAYSIQDFAINLWDKPIGGWKVGRIGSPFDKELGANRLSGPIFADLVKDAGGELSMAIFHGGFAAVEAEFMLRLSPPENAALPTTDAETFAWVDQVRIGIEVASSPYAGINADGPCVTISDHGNNFGLVLGTEVPRETWASINSIGVAMEIDGETVGSATAADMLDGPFGAVRFLLANLAERNMAVPAGTWVSSGAVTGVHQIEAGSDATASFDGLGKVSIRVT